MSPKARSLFMRSLSCCAITSAAPPGRRDRRRITGREPAQLRVSLGPLANEVTNGAADQIERFTRGPALLAWHQRPLRRRCHKPAEGELCTDAAQDWGGVRTRRPPWYRPSSSSTTWFQILVTRPIFAGEDPVAGPHRLGRPRHPSTSTARRGSPCEYPRLRIPRCGDEDLPGDIKDALRVIPPRVVPGTGQPVAQVPQPPSRRQNH